MMYVFSYVLDWSEEGLSCPKYILPVILRCVDQIHSSFYQILDKYDVVSVVGKNTGT